MRQAGILAAAGLAALKNIPSLAADHRRAFRLAAGLQQLPSIKISPFPPPTNIVLLDVRATGLTAQEFITRLAAQNVRAVDFGKHLVRMVTHRNVDDEDIDFARHAVTDLCREL